MNIHISRLTCTFFAWSWSSEAAPVWSDYLALLKHAYNVKQKKVGKSQLTFQGEDLVVFCLTQERFGKDRRFAHMFSLSDLSIDWQFIDTGCVVNTIMGAAFRWMTLAHLHIFVDLLVYPCILDTLRLTYHAWQFLSWYLWRFFSMCVCPYCGCNILDLSRDCKGDFNPNSPSPIDLGHHGRTSLSSHTQATW